MENTALITNILSENYVDAEKQIHETLAQYTNTKMDGIKQLIAASYFGESAEAKEDEEDQMDDEAGEKSGIEKAETSKKEASMAKKDMTEETLEEASVTRKHFQQVADIIKEIPDAKKRSELAHHHAAIFAKQNPRFDHARFHAACNSAMQK